MTLCQGNFVDIKTVGERLREERIRARLSQTELGEVGGVKVKTQGAYERNERKPDTGYLERVSHLVDIGYITQGRSSKDAVKIFVQLAQQFDFRSLSADKTEELCMFIYKGGHKLEDMIHYLRSVSVKEYGDENLTRLEIIERNAPAMINKSLDEHYDLSSMSKAGIKECVQLVLDGKRNIATIEIEIEQHGGKRR